jgi:hypothetical protein
MSAFGYVLCVIFALMVVVPVALVMPHAYAARAPLDPGITTRIILAVIAGVGLTSFALTLVFST